MNGTAMNTKMTVMKTFVVINMVAIALIANSSTVKAATYNVATDFSGIANPAGVWSYGYTLGLGGAFTLFPDAYPNLPANGSILDLWRDDSFLNQGVPAAFKNVGSVTSADSILPGQFALHPGHSNSYAVLRFTAPATDTYTLTSQYFVGNTGQTSIDVYRNSGSASPLFSSATTSSSPSFNSNIFLNAGDTLSFAVGSASDGFLSDTTPLNVQLVSTNAPEPATIALLSFGVVGGLVRRRRG